MPLEGLGWGFYGGRYQRRFREVSRAQEDQAGRSLLPSGVKSLRFVAIEVIGEELFLELLIPFRVALPEYLKGVERIRHDALAQSGVVRGRCRGCLRFQYHLQLS